MVLQFCFIIHKTNLNLLQSGKIRKHIAHPHISPKIPVPVFLIIHYLKISENIPAATMKFTKSQKEPKKSPEEEYASQISTLTENELRDLHKDLKIDHYGNSTAAVINTASGVGLLSMRSTTRRYKTECMQIEAIEARMKENGWTPHPHRYRDAVPIALGVAAGTTAGMTFGLINVEKNAKRTRDYVKKKDLFNTKELVQTDKVLGTNETEGVEVVKEVEPAEITVERTQTPSTTITESVTTQHTILRKPLPNTAATETQVKTSQTQSLSIETTNATSIPTAEPTITKTPPSPPLSPPTEESQTPEPTPPKKQK